MSSWPVTLLLPLVLLGCFGCSSAGAQEKPLKLGFPVHLVDDPPCQQLALGHWKPAEKVAWAEICKHLPVVLSNEPVTPANARPENTLSEDFLARVFGDPQFTRYTWSFPIRIYGAHIPNLTIDTANLKSLDVRNSYIETLCIKNTMLETDMRIERSAIGRAEVNALTARGLLLIDDAVDTISISLSRLSDRIYIYHGQYGSLEIKHSKTDDILIDTLGWKDPGNSALLITETLDPGVFTFIGEPPPRINFRTFTFNSALWDDKPIDKLRKIAEASYSPAMYETVAKSYANRGRSALAQQIMVERHDQDYRRGEWSEKVPLFLSWALYGYGYHPELGLFWIVVFVAIGTGVFWSDRHVISEAKPSHPFVFALDSVIPVIHLDKIHDDVRFAGGRQYFLYFLRFLGAVLVVLVLDVLRRSVVGSG